MANSSLYSAYSRAVSKSAGEDDFYGEEQSVSSMLRELLNQQRAAAERERRAAQKQLEESERSALQGEYVRNQQNKNGMAQRLAGYGAGGLSESAGIALEAEYGNSRNDIWKKKVDEERKLNEAYQRQLDAGMQDYYSALSSYNRYNEEQRRNQERFDEEMAYKREKDEYARQQAAAKNAATAAKSGSTGYSKGKPTTPKVTSKAADEAKKAAEKQGYFNSLYNQLKGYNDNYLREFPLMDRESKNNMLRKQVAKLVENRRLTMDEAHKMMARLGI